MPSLRRQKARPISHGVGICIEMAAGCYVLVDHSKPGVPPSSNAQEAPAEEPTLDANAIPEAKSEPLSMAATQPGTSWKQQDTKTAQEPMARTAFRQTRRNERKI